MAKQELVDQSVAKQNSFTYIRENLQSLKQVCNDEQYAKELLRISQEEPGNIPLQEAVGLELGEIAEASAKVLREGGTLFNKR